jgi:hypothetical protein
VQTGQKKKGKESEKESRGKKKIGERVVERGRGRRTPIRKPVPVSEMRIPRVYSSAKPTMLPNTNKMEPMMETTNPPDLNARFKGERCESSAKSVQKKKKKERKRIFLGMVL